MSIKVNEHNIPEIQNLYKMNSQDIEKFAESAALAYKEYPLFKYLTQNRFEHDVIKNIIAASLNSMNTNIIGVSTEKEANAIAIFVPPNYTGGKTIPFLIGGGFKLLKLTSAGIFLRLLRYENHAMKIKKKYTNHNSWYLYNVTVKPEYQRKGMSSALLKPMFEYLDREGQDCYLETHKEENVKIYEHYGFELLEVSKIPKTDIVQYSMLRRAKRDDFINKVYMNKQ